MNKIPPVSNSCATLAIVRAIPITFKMACEYIREHYRHNKPPTGMKFCVGCEVDGTLVGVVTAGRPVARALDDGLTIEINRTCTNGHPNANSFLYARARRIAKEMGYRRAITYTQEGETGASLKADGWRIARVLEERAGWADSSGPKWKSKRDPIGNGGVMRVRWEVELGP